MIRYMLQAKRAAGAFMLVSGVATAACAGITELDVAVPPVQEFGFGPRVSAEQLFVARVEPREPIRVNRLHVWRLELYQADGVAITGATIAVDGGMPQHGHGLPTRPRVTKDLANGTYEVDGMRFNMGGWWVVTFRVTTAAGTDTVTFNLML